MLPIMIIMIIFNPPRWQLGPSPLPLSPFFFPHLNVLREVYTMPYRPIDIVTCRRIIIKHCQRNYGRTQALTVMTCLHILQIWQFLNILHILYFLHILYIFHILQIFHILHFRNSQFGLAHFRNSRFELAHFRNSLFGAGPFKKTFEKMSIGG